MGKSIGKTKLLPFNNATSEEIFTAEGSDKMSKE